MIPIKRPFYRIISYILNSNYFRESLFNASKDLFCQNNNSQINQLSLHNIPAQYKYGTENIENSEKDLSPVFVTARFRSGSTYFWQLFRNIEGATSYYEPLNENRWYLYNNAEPNVDPTHIGVNDYHKEYAGKKYLDRWFRHEWSYRFLYMDEKHYDPDLYNYIRALIQGTSGRPVLQFNRMDFRLRWLKSNFPDAKIVHLYRDPREQWMSIQRDGGVVPLDYELSSSSNLALFDTIHWARDLRHVFPFLGLDNGIHPYAIHYLLWRTSYSFGKRYADYSIAYEDIITGFKETFGNLLSDLGIKGVDLNQLSQLNQGKIKDSWRGYAPDSWYKEIETECDRILRTFFDA
ncbi:MAG: sulfotransferase [Planctomycetes bacterium]|nr:sulfotransferase [Planctomycetota bacterium]